MDFGLAAVADAATHSQRITTVSPTYADQIRGTPALAPHGAKFCGVVNGIDPEIWDPLNDPALPLPYYFATCAAGKAAAKAALRARVGLADGGPDGGPLVGVVTRLTTQKGVHLIEHALYRALERGGQVALLGSAPDGNVGRAFERARGDMARRWPGQASLTFRFDEPLSHLIYAACDLLLVPSMFEPCGLSQLIGSAFRRLGRGGDSFGRLAAPLPLPPPHPPPTPAVRYGAVPLVRRTGGLADTVFDVDTDGARAAAAGVAPNGFVFEGSDGAAMDWALNRALDMWYTRRPEFEALQAACMAQDWGWGRSAAAYVDIYHAATRAGR